MSKTAIPKKYIENLRNIGIIAHIDAGKTTLTERILYYTDKIHRMGEVHDGTATMDFMPEEQERGITITSACTTCLWAGKTVNIIDTPGHVDFTIEVERALRVLDGAVGVFCAVGGVEPQSETVWRQSEKFNIPKLAFVNKMDRLGADFYNVLEAMKKRLKTVPLPLQMPIGAGEDFCGIVDLLTLETLTFDLESHGRSFERSAAEGDVREQALAMREKTIETLAELDDELLEMFLAGDDIPVSRIQETIRKATRELKVVPVFVGSALKNIGVQPVMDAVCVYLPSPLDAFPVTGTDLKTKERKTVAPSMSDPLAALVFKVSMETGRKLAWLRIYSGKMEPGGTVYNCTQEKDERAARLFRLHAGHKEKIETAVAGDIVAAAGMKFARTGDSLCESGNPVLLERIAEYKPVISLAVEPKNTTEGDKLDEVLEKFLLEDPTLFIQKDEETGQRILSGMGELHLEVMLDRLKREYSLEPRAGRPQVVYQETVRKPAGGIGEFHRELAEKMHYGYVALQVEPLPRDKGTDIRFDFDTEGWNTAWLDAVHEGIADALQSGVLKGYPVRDIRVSIKELRKKEGESGPVGFHMAAVAGIKDALEKADSVLLEPIMNVEISVPEEFTGDAVSLLGTKGAKVENMFDRAGLKVIQALTPMRKLFGFSTELRSATQGRAGLMVKFARFDVLE